MINKIKNLIKNYYNNTYFFSFLLLKPRPNKNWGSNEYSSSHLKKKGEEYHKKFISFEGRSILWNLEKKILLNFLKEKKLISHLDFASGSGRIAILLREFFKDQYLLDVSKSMAQVNKEELKNSKIIIEDFRNKDPLKDKKFDLITVFRFFPNAEPDLRKKALKYLSDHIKDNGYIILNNHRNFWSIPFSLGRLLFLSDGFGMTHKEIDNLLEKNNLKLIKFFSIGLFTAREKSKIIPWNIIRLMENLFFKAFKGKHKLGYNVIYILKKKHD
tara:strand:- start:4097 stop:4912 length:816 start_codon:yes stop_codon:yes gene_type:complete